MEKPDTLISENGPTANVLASHRLQDRNKLPKVWHLVKEKYKIGNIIGRGPGSVVVEAKDRNTKKKVAIKHIELCYEKDYVCMKTLREIQLLRHLSLMTENVHTVKLLDAIVSNDMNDIFLVMNYVKFDLKDLISHVEADHIHFTEEQTVLVLFKMLCALDFVHNANIIHRDLKPSNLLVNEQLEIQLCDFGLSRTLPKIETKKKSYTR